MVFPIFILAGLLFVILLAIALVVYFQVYKSRINKALNAQTKPAAMAPPYKVVAALTTAALVIGIFVSYLAGYKAANDRYVTASMTFDVHSFYAEVTQVDDGSITVDGLDLNDKAYRGEFTYEVYDGVGVTWRDAPIRITDIEPGDMVCVTLVTGGGDVTGLFKIQLLS